MIEKLDVINSGINVIDRFGFTQNVPVARIYCNKINEIIDIINAIVVDVDGTKCVDGSKAPADNSGKANCQENVQDELERTRKALDKAKWWLHEIVESHRCTPISTAEMALEDITALEQKD